MTERRYTEEDVEYLHHVMSAADGIVEVRRILPHITSRIRMAERIYDATIPDGNADGLAEIHDKLIAMVPELELMSDDMDEIIRSYRKGRGEE